MIRFKFVDSGGRWLLLSVLTAVLLLSSRGVQSQQEETLSKTDVAEVIDSIVVAFEAHYVYPDTARAMSEYIRKRFAEGAYDDVTDLSSVVEKLRHDMREFTHDRHIYVAVMSPDDPPAIGDTITDAEIARRARSNFNIKKVEWMTGNVGYVRFDGFEDAAYAGEAAAAAMNLLARCDAVIIDLRYNHGGHETMVKFLASYFFKKPTIINALYFPETDSLEQSWTTVWVPGRKLVDTDLYILTSARTASGAEAFSYGMKHAGRAVIVGETTAGAAHWTESYDFPSLRIRASIPIARPINPVTKTSWERTGVTPHVKAASEDALTIAHSEALREILKRTTDKHLRRELNWDLVALEARAVPFTLTLEQMPAYTGEFDGGRYAILIKQDALFWRYVDGTEFVLIPYSADLFGFDDTDDYRIEVIREDGGTVTGFRLLVRGGEPGPVRDRTGDI